MWRFLPWATSTHQCNKKKRKNQPGWREFSTDALGEMLLITFNKIVYGYIVDATIKLIILPPAVDSWWCQKVQYTCIVYFWYFRISLYFKTCFSFKFLVGFAWWIISLVAQKYIKSNLHIFLLYINVIISYSFSKEYKNECCGNPCGWHHIRNYPRRIANTCCTSTNTFTLTSFLY